MVKLSALKPNPNNPRIIKNDRFKQLVKSIQDFPKMMNKRPIVYDSNGIVIAGNQRFRALQELGYKEIPDEWAVSAEDFTPEEIRRFILLDNEGFWETNFEMLANEYDETELMDWGILVPGVSLTDEFGEDFSLPDGDKAPFQQMTFTLADAQADFDAAFGKGADKRLHGYNGAKTVNYPQKREAE